MALLFLGLAVLAIALSVLPVTQSGLTIILIAAFGVVCLVPTMVDSFLNRFEFFDLIHLMCYLAFIQFGLATLYILYDPRATYDSTVMDYLNVSLMLCIVGVSSMIYGYVLTRRMGGKNVSSPGKEIHGVVWIAIIFAIGAMGQYATLTAAGRVYRPDRLSGVLSLFQQLDYLSHFACFLLLFQFFSRKSSAGQRALLWFLVLPLQAGFLYAFIGSKTFCMTFLGIPIVAYRFARGRFPRKSLVALALLIVFVVFPFYNAFRNVSHSYSAGTRVAKAVEILSSYSAKSYTDNSFYQVGNRLALINSIAVIVRDTGKTVDYQYGKTLTLAIVSLAIPRILWPDKPLINLGTQFGRTFHITPRFAPESWISITAVGEFYWNFGIPGVIGGMFLLGVMLQLMYRYYGQAGANDPIRLGMYISLLSSLLAIDGNLAAWSAGTIRNLAVCAFIIAILKRVPNAVTTIRTPDPAALVPVGSES